MKTIPAALQTHLDAGVTTLATCVKITARDGTVIAFTDHVADLPVEGITYSTRAGHTPTAIESSSDLSVDNLDVTGLFAESGIEESAVASGKFDYATIEVFLVNYPDPAAGIIKLKRGFFGEVTVEEGRYKAEIRGLTQALQQTIGELYSPDCRADLFDMTFQGGARVVATKRRCTLNHADFVVSGTVSAVDAAEPRRKFTGSTSGTEDWFKYGLVVFTSGANANRGMEVKESGAAGEIELFEALPGVIQVGDGYEINPGCDKAVLTCRDKFANVINFRGEPYVPGIHALREYRIAPNRQETG